MKHIVSAALTALGLSAAGYLIGSGFVDAHLPQRTVQVKGLAEKKVKANQGQWQIRYKVVNNELSGLYQNIENSEKEIATFLRGQGFKPQEIVIQPQNINDNQGNSYSSNNSAPRYSADGSVAVFTSDVDSILKSTQKVGELVKNGVVITGTSTQFRFTKLNTIKPAMLLEATANARKAGETFAQQSKSKLGPIKDARQGLFTISGANSSYDSASEVIKKVRVVSTVTFLLN